jgi:hypothetical protein
MVMVCGAEARISNNPVACDAPSGPIAANTLTCVPPAGVGFIAVNFIVPIMVAMQSRLDALLLLSCKVRFPFALSVAFIRSKITLSLAGVGAAVSDAK